MAESDTQTDQNAQTDQKVTIDGKDYTLDSLSDIAKAQLANIRFVDREIDDAKNHLSVLQAARQYYAGVLSKELPEGQG